MNDPRKSLERKIQAGQHNTRFSAWFNISGEQREQILEQSTGYLAMRRKLAALEQASENISDNEYQNEDHNMQLAIIARHLNPQITPAIRSESEYNRNIAQILDAVFNKEYK